jgi:hypothetical protein
MQLHPIAVVSASPLFAIGDDLVHTWVRELRGQLIRSGMASGGPAATPTNALVSDRPTSFLTGSRNTTPYMAVL